MELLSRGQSLKDIVPGVVYVFDNPVCPSLTLPEIYVLEPWKVGSSDYFSTVNYSVQGHFILRCSCHTRLSRSQK